MKTINAQTLTDATISALERTAMVLAEPAPEGDEHAPVTRFARIIYSGPSGGTLTLGATDQFLRDLAASLLGVEAAEVSVEVQGTDALKEIANILGGSVILAMSGETCEYSLGLPEIVVAAEMPEGGAPGSKASAGCTVIADEGVLRVLWTQDAAAQAA